MKLKLQARPLATGTALNELTEWMSSELAGDVKVTDGYIEQVDSMSESWEQADIFSLGQDYGKFKEREYWSRPESFLLPDEYAKVLEEAIKQWSRETYHTCDSITFSKRHTAKALTEVTVAPTKVIALFGIFMRYGKLCKDYQDAL